MAIREFVSNAIDASYKMTDSPVNGCRIEYVTEISVDPTKTRIFIPVQNPFERDKYFLHFLHPTVNWGKSAVIEKSSLSPAKIYRRGVLVFEDSIPSLFDYNFADIRLDESRNLDKSSIYTNIKREFALDLLREHKGKILQAIVKDETNDGEIVETKVYWGGGFLGTDETGLSVWNEFVGKDKVAVLNMTANQNTIDAIRHKGKIPVRIINHNSSAMRYWGIPKDSDFITVEAEITKRVITPTVTHQKIFNNVWASIELAGMARKAVPKFFFFESADSGVLGYCQDGAVYVNLDLSHKHKELSKTILEEVTHYITNEGDFSRGFQEFLLELVYNVVLK